MAERILKFKCVSKLHENSDKGRLGGVSPGRARTQRFGPKRNHPPPNPESPLGREEGAGEGGEASPAESRRLGVRGGG